MIDKVLSFFASNFTIGKPVDTATAALIFDRIKGELPADVICEHLSQDSMDTDTAIMIFDRIKGKLPADVIWKHLSQNNRDWFINKSRLLVEKESKVVK